MQLFHSPRNTSASAGILFKPLSSGIAPSNNGLLPFSEPKPPQYPMLQSSRCPCLTTLRLYVFFLVGLSLLLSFHFKSPSSRSTITFHGHCPFIYTISFLAFVSSTHPSWAIDASAAYDGFRLSLRIDHHNTGHHLLQDDLPFFHTITKVHYPTRRPSIYSNVYIVL